MRFGIITNGELEFQTAKIVRLALDGRVEQVIASGDVGIAKPEAGIFHEAVERFRRSRPVSAAAYVGDRLRTDAIGAARAGLVGVWLNRHGVEPADDEAAEASAAGVIEIRGLDELVAQLRAAARAARDVRTGRAHPHAPDPSSHRTLR